MFPLPKRLAALAAAVAFSSVAALALVAPAAVAEDTCYPRPDACVLGVSQTDVCGEKPPIQGETCVHHTRLVVGVPGPGSGPRVVVDRENATGSVLALNTRNSWASERVYVAVENGPAPIVVGAHVYLSAMQPSSSDAGQLDAYAFGPDASGRPMVGARVMQRNLEPQYCVLYSPNGPVTVDCGATSIYEILPIVP